MNSPETRVPPGFRAPRRVASAPVTPRSPSLDASAASEAVETLYFHPNVKIVSFTTSGKAQLQNNDAAREEAGTLAASSPTERTIAVAPLRIYRAPGSVAFLSCGSALQPMLPKSQCWCIDEDNRVFVLQIRRPSYWRIELPPAPDGEEDDNTKALREVFDIILQFEKTYCPFRRSFSVELPEEPTTPVKKIPWTPKVTPNSPAPLFRPFTPEPISPASPGIFRSLTGLEGHRPRDRAPSSPTSGLELQYAPSSESLQSATESPRSSGSEYTFDNGIPIRNSSPISSIVNQETSESGTSPTVPKLVDAIQSRAVEDTVPIVPRDMLADQNAASPTAPIWAHKVTPFHSESTLFHSELTPFHSESNTTETSPTETLSHTQGDVKSLAQALSSSLLSAPALSCSQPHLSPTTVSEDDASTVGKHDDELDLSGQVSPTPSQDSFHSVESWHSLQNARSRDSPKSPDQTPNVRSDISSSTALEIRQSFVRRRSKRDSINATTVFPPIIEGERLTARNLPMIIMNKTCEILLGPPAHLLALMLRIAARITAGEWRGQVLGYGDNGEYVPVHWDISDDDDLDD